MKTELKWFEDFVGLTVAKRKEILKDILSKLASSKNSSDRAIVKKLRDKEYELIGLTPRVSYVLIDGPKNEIDAQFIHPFGTYTLLFWHKKTNEIRMYNPFLRLNDSVLSEVKGNPKNYVRGFTG